MTQEIRGWLGVSNTEIPLKYLPVRFELLQADATPEIPQSLIAIVTTPANGVSFHPGEAIISDINGIKIVLRYREEEVVAHVFGNLPADLGAMAH
jgi:hypothetical protein